MIKIQDLPRNITFSITMDITGYAGTVVPSNPTAILDENDQAITDENASDILDEG